MTEKEAKKRLEELREVLHNEEISYGELAELQSLKEYIQPGDVELLEAAGVPEFPIEIPLVCPQCEKVTEVVEISNAVVSDVFFQWNEDKKHYLETYENQENFGDLYLECSECEHRFSNEEYEAFQMSNPYCKVSVMMDGANSIIPCGICGKDVLQSTECKTCYSKRIGITA